MAGRPCTIWADTAKAALACQLIATGVTDQGVADRLGVNRSAVGRHRKNHILAPTRALVAAASKGQDVAAQRQDMIAAAEAGDPVAVLALSAIVADLRRVHDRLERTAGEAEHGGQRVAVAALSGQQLRAAEVRAKLGGAGGYSPGKTSGDASAGSFSVNIHLGPDRVE